MRGKVEKDRQKTVVICLFFVSLFLASKNIHFYNSNELFFGSMLEDCINLCFYLIPVLYIRSLKILRNVNAMVLCIALLSGLSAFLVSVGVVTLPMDRFEASPPRLGLSSQGYWHFGALR